MLKYVPAYFDENYKNVVFAGVNFTKLLANTSEYKMIDGQDDKGIGDVLRIVLLFRFGGIFFNGDVISVRPVPNKHQVHKIIMFVLRDRAVGIVQLISGSVSL